jgi:protein-L-isoaspartate(D-aspartate) O-methyltransferase
MKTVHRACIVTLGLVALPGVFLMHARAADAARQEERDAMVVEQIESRGVRDPTVLRALRSVPRHLYVPSRHQASAYADHPLPIGHGQTISQPYIVALMTRLLDVKPGSRILEVGTGSGYQAAVLAEITPHVHTIEIIRPLHDAARIRLAALTRLDSSHVRHGDGYNGLPDRAPFDGIIVTAASDHIPPPLLRQLKPGGRMVIPIGPVHATQRLVLVEKNTEGKIRTHSILPVVFVPLTRAEPR